MNKHFWLYRLPPVVWMVLIYFLSSIPEADLPDIDIPYIHLIAHLGEYGVLGFLMVRAFLSSVGVGEIKLAVIATWIGSVIFAATDEWHQTFIAGRNGEWITVGLDAIFALLGIVFYLWLIKIFKRSEVNERN